MAYGSFGWWRGPEKNDIEQQAVRAIYTQNLRIVILVKKSVMETGSLGFYSKN